MTNVFSDINNIRDIRSARALTNDQIRSAAPSVFAERPWHAVSERYAFIPTIQVIDKMRAEGFEPVEAKQSRTRIEGKGDFTKHMIRFRDVRQGQLGDASLRLGQLFAELMLTNAHDGASAYKLDAALFRLTCLNGMIVDDQTIAPINVRHSGNPGDVVDATYEIVEQFPKMLESVERFQQLRLTAPEQEAFGAAALALRYDEGKAPITARQAVAIHRDEDSDNTLWNTFNAAQENLIQGGQRGRTESGRRTRTRKIEGIAENTRLNKALWTLAEELRKLRN